LGDTHGGGIFRLPLIRNRKTIDPRDPESPPVFQLETAMGSAVELFDGAAGLRVPRARFAPVKLCSDLLTLWSDAYELTADYHLVAHTDNHFGVPVVLLDPAYYKRIADMEARFPFGPPSLRACEQLTVEGDVTFGREVAVRGRATVRARTPACVADRTLLQGDTLL